MISSIRKAVQRRSLSTRETLVHAAMRIFAEKGYSGASTREIAEIAGANLGSIRYHFESKKGLYLAVFEHMSEQIGERMELELDLDALERHVGGNEEPSDPDSGLDEREEILSALNALLSVLTDPRSETWARLILSEQQCPSEAFDLLYKRIISRVLDRMARSVANEMGGDRLDPDVRLVTLTLLGQAFVFRAARTTVERFMDWKDITDAERQQISRRIASNVFRILGDRQ